MKTKTFEHAMSLKHTIQELKSEIAQIGDIVGMASSASLEIIVDVYAPSGRREQVQIHDKELKEQLVQFLLESVKAKKSKLIELKREFEEL